MERKLVTEEELLSILNQDLHKTENPEDYRFENVIRLAGRAGLAKLDRCISEEDAL